MLLERETVARAGSSARLGLARKAQAVWAARPIRERLTVLQRVRRMIARKPDPLLRSLAERPNRSTTDTLLAEILPVADACRFLEREAARLLAPRRLGVRGRPFWLAGTRAEVRREPWGVVLIIGPNNYPLLLTAVPALQALATGNAVLIKPAPGCEDPARAFGDLLTGAGLPDGLCQVLGSGVDEVEASLEAGIDHVVLTGSANTGRALLTRLAPEIVPVTLELSGNDAVFVLPGADLAMVADALFYGLRLNGSATCIAPRRVFAQRDQLAELERRMAPRLAAARPVDVPAPVRERVSELLDEAVAAGGRLVPDSPRAPDGRFRPVAVADASPDWRLLQEDVFAPVVSMVAIEDMEQALAFDARCGYALGASVFGPPDQAARLAGRIDAGSVSVNDVIVPTADPRLPFGGRRRSGFGVTRGAEGLLAMTTVKTVSIRRGRVRPHYDELPAGAEEVVRAWLRAAHGGGFGHRLRSIGHVLAKLASLSRNSAS